MRRVEKFVFSALFLFILVGYSHSAYSAEPESCRLTVKEHWPRSTQPNQNEEALARHLFFREIGILLDTAYKNGGYIQNPASFPVAYTDFRDDLIAIEFRTPCARARVFLGELLQAYRKRASSKLRNVSPDLIIGEDKQ